jgi:hypothetical protein
MNFLFPPLLQACERAKRSGLRVRCVRVSVG